MYDSGHNDDDVYVMRLRQDKNKLVTFGNLTRTSIRVTDDPFVY